MSDAKQANTNETEGKQNDKVQTDLKPQFKDRPEQYPATRDSGDNVDADTSK